MGRNKKEQKQQKGCFTCKICNASVPDGCEERHKSGKRHKKWEQVHQRNANKTSRTLFVRNMPVGTSDLELIDYFSKYGPVSTVRIPQNKPYSFVEFSCPVDELDVLKQKHILRGRVLVVNRALPSENKKQNFVLPTPIDITKGQHILDQIEDHSPLETQIKTFLSLVQLTEEELLMRREFVHFMTSGLQDFFPGSRVEVFGSTANGLGFTGCDIDLSFFLPFERNESQIITFKDEDAPTPTDVHLGKFPRDELGYLSARNIVRFIFKIICRSPHFKFVRFIPSLRCPIVKFHHKSSNTCGDVSFSKSLGLANTRLLRLYGQLDLKIYALLMTLRFWGKREQFVGSNHLISSYSFSWLIIFYLQRKNIVPTVETLASLSEIKSEAEKWDCTFCEDMNRIPVHTANKSFSDLITGFFEFYTNFDFTVNVICPRDGSSSDKSKLLAEIGDELDFRITSMSVQDVFDLTHNITGAVNDATIQLFLSKCTEQYSVWKTMTREGKANIKCLFNSELVEMKPTVSCPLPSLEAKPATSLQHFSVESKQAATVELPSDQDSICVSLLARKGKIRELDKVCSFVLDVLKRAFLFECNVSNSSSDFSIHTTSPCIRKSEERSVKRPKSDPEEERFLLSMSCKAYHRTWAGRKKVKGFVSVSESVPQLEIEENIAKELAKSSGEKPDEVLHAFEVTLYLGADGQTLRVTFTPHSSKNELIFTVIPFVKKFILAISQSCLDKYLTGV